MPDDMKCGDPGVGVGHHPNDFVLVAGFVVGVKPHFNASLFSLGQGFARPGFGHRATTCRRHVCDQCHPRSLVDEMKIITKLSARTDGVEGEDRVAKRQMRALRCRAGRSRRGGGVEHQRGVDGLRGFACRQADCQGGNHTRQPLP